MQSALSGCRTGWMPVPIVLFACCLGAILPSSSHFPFRGCLLPNSVLVGRSPSSCTHVVGICPSDAWHKLLTVPHACYKVRRGWCRRVCCGNHFC